MQAKNGSKWWGKLLETANKNNDTRNVSLKINQEKEENQNVLRNYIETILKNLIRIKKKRKRIADGSDSSWPMVKTVWNNKLRTYLETETHEKPKENNVE